MSSILGALRLPHWIGLGLVVVALGGGIPSGWYGLLGAQASGAKRLTSCLERHHIDMASLLTTVGSPAALLNGGALGQGEKAVRAAERHGKLERRQANAVIGCVRGIAAR